MALIIGAQAIDVEPAGDDTTEIVSAIPNLLPVSWILFSIDKCAHQTAVQVKNLQSNRTFYFQLITNNRAGIEGIGGVLIEGKFLWRGNWVVTDARSTYGEICCKELPVNNFVAGVDLSATIRVIPESD